MNECGGTGYVICTLSTAHLLSIRTKKRVADEGDAFFVNLKVVL